MGKWAVEVREKVLKKKVPKLPKDVKGIFDLALRDLEEEGPFPKGWNVKQIDYGECRMKLKQKWRMKYKYEGSKMWIEVIYVGSREDIEY